MGMCRLNNIVMMAILALLALFTEQCCRNPWTSVMDPFATIGIAKCCTRKHCHHTVPNGVRPATHAPNKIEIGGETTEEGIAHEARKGGGEPSPSFQCQQC